MESGPQFPQPSRAEALLMRAQQFVDLENKLIASEQAQKGIEDELSGLTSEEKSLTTVTTDLLRPGEKDPKDRYEEIQQRFEFLKAKLATLEESHKVLLKEKIAFLEKFDRDFPKEQKQFEILTKNISDHGALNEFPDTSKHLN